MFIRHDGVGTSFANDSPRDLRLYSIVPPSKARKEADESLQQNDELVAKESKTTSITASLRQRLQDIEKKLRQYKILQNPGKDESSADGSSSEVDKRKNAGLPVNSSTMLKEPLHSNSSHTSPLPRKPLPLFVDKNLPKRLEYEFSPKNSVEGYNVLPSPRKQSDSTETQRRVDAIMKQTGVLKRDGKEYKMQPNDLEFLSDLGHGVCGHVVKMKHKETGLLMAVKQMRRSGNKEENKQIIMDLEVVLRSHDCPFIVQCLGCFVTDVEVWICMELMDTCMDKLMQRTHKAIPESILGKVALSIVKALRYLKDNLGVIHRDVKPSNILLNRDGTIKLCDFGISGRLVDSKAATQTAGCAAYMAVMFYSVTFSKVLSFIPDFVSYCPGFIFKPERIQPPDPRNANYDIRADVWSLGISLVEMALGRFPYGICENHFEILTKILLTDSPTLSPKDGFTPTFCDFLSHCLAKDYHKRPKYGELLVHPFLLLYETKFIDVAGWLEKQLAEADPLNVNRPKI